MNYQSYYPYRKAMPLSKQINFQQVSTYILLVTQIRYKNKKKLFFQDIYCFKYWELYKIFALYLLTYINCIL